MQILIELDRAASTVSGRLTVGDEPGRPFFGWLELIDSVERLREGRSADTSGSRDDHDTGKRDRRRDR